MRNYIILFFILNISLLIATDVSGIQTGTWELTDSPFTVIGDITIPSGDELTIEPGVLVEFNGPFGITAEGILVAQGTETDTIYFDRYPTYSGYWDELRLEQETGEGYEFSYCYIRGADNGVNSIDAPLYLHHCHLDANNTGVNLFAIGNTNPPDVTIEYCLIENSYLNGIDIYESNPLIRNNEITNNGMGTQYRGAIQVNIQSTGAVCTPEIVDNYIHHNREQGITCTDMFSAGTISADINNNVLEGNLTGVYFYNCGGNLINNEIFDNYITGDMNSGAGVMCYGSGAIPFICNNLITGNYCALYIVNNANPCLGNSVSMNPLEQGQNTFMENFDANGTNNSVYVSDCSDDYTILAENNTWDSENYDEISATIHDHEDNGSLPSVDFDPIFMPPQQLLSGIFTYTGGYEIDSWTLILQSVNYSLDEEIYPVEEGSFELTSIPSGYYFLFIEGTSYEPVSVRGSYGDYRFPEILTITDESRYTDLEIIVDDFEEYRYYYVAREFDEGEYTLYHLVEGNVSPICQYLLYQEGDFLRFFGRPAYGENGWEIETYIPGEYIYIKNRNLQVGDTWTSMRLWPGDETVMLDFTVTARDTQAIAEQLREAFICEAISNDNNLYEYEVAAGIGNVSEMGLNEDGLINKYFQLNTDSMCIPGGTTSFLPLGQDYFTELLIQDTPGYPWGLRFSWGTDDCDILFWNPPHNHVNIQNYRIYANDEMIAETANYEHHYDVPLPLYEDTDFYITAWDGSDETEPSNTITWIVPAEDEDNLIEATEISLNQNYPNPFGISDKRQNLTTISFYLGEETDARMDIFNIKGEKVRTLLDESRISGEHTVFWDGKNEQGRLCAAGLYLFRLLCSDKSISKKLILIR